MSNFSWVLVTLVISTGRPTGIFSLPYPALIFPKYMDSSKLYYNSLPFSDRALFFFPFPPPTFLPFLSIFRCDRSRFYLSLYYFPWYRPLRSTTQSFRHSSFADRCISRTCVLATDSPHRYPLRPFFLHNDVWALSLEFSTLVTLWGRSCVGLLSTVRPNLARSCTAAHCDRFSAISGSPTANRFAALRSPKADRALFFSRPSWHPR